MIDKLSPEARTFLSDFLAQIEYEKDGEIERLNNIINEIIKICEENEYLTLIKNIEELKGSDKK